MIRSIVIDREGPEKNLDHDLIDIFFEKAVNYDSKLRRDHQIRCIGIDEETTGLILDFIKKKQKVATFSLPWIMTIEKHPNSVINMPIILLGYDGTPEVMIQISNLYNTTFGEITYKETQMDGPPVQDPDIWIPLHRDYWNGLLKKYNKSCTDDMPIIVEEFNFIFAQK
ncbi:MAG: hypothetical protein HOF02_02805 [Gammaproteobacteria bacterium]|nr:hypothetical protein [Gammaproteobacteria bacterium]MBT7754099.1 hypothetical protein [Gammaproteobacteria bacterium]